MGKISKEKFEKWYSLRSGIKLDDLKNNYGFHAVECNCSYEHCKGWRVEFSESLITEEDNDEEE